MALATVLAVVLYRMSILAALSVQGTDSVITGYAILFTTATAATINLFLICIFNWVNTLSPQFLTFFSLHTTIKLNCTAISKLLYFD